MNRVESLPQDFTTRANAPKEKRYALTFGGGGSRGVVETIVLEQIEKKVSKVTGEIFDLFTAQSVGTLIASYLSMVEDGKFIHCAKDGYNLTNEIAPLIFKRSGIYDVESLDGTRLCKYTADGMVSVLQDKFADYKIGDLGNEQFFPAVCTSGYPTNPIISFTRDKALNNPDWNLNLRDILRGTTAAQTYFPSQEISIGTTSYMINDPGLYDNTGITRSESELYRLYNCDRKDIVVVFLGTGTSNTPFPNKIGNAGIIDYAAQIAPLDMTCNSAMQVEIASNNLGLNKGFWNLNPPIDPVPLDTTDPDLIQKIVDQTSCWIENSEDLFRDLGKALGSQE